jgi:hypothetical protein
MMHTIAAPLRSAMLVALIVLSLPIVATAATITMYLTDFDTLYLGSQNDGTGAIYDATALPGATGGFDTTLAESLQAASFKLDSTALGTIVNVPGPGNGADDMWGDLRVNGVGGTLARNAINFNKGNNNGTFGFDWFTKAFNNGGAVGNYLQLGLTSVNVTITDGTLGPGKEFTVAGTATVLSQNLPFGLAFDTGQLVQFTYSAPNPGIVGSDPNNTTGVLAASGAMTITGTQVIPEPASIALVCAGGLMLGITVLRRPRNRRAA